MKKTQQSKRSRTANGRRNTSSPSAGRISTSEVHVLKLFVRSTLGTAPAEQPEAVIGRVHREEYGFDRFRQTLERHASGTAQELIDGVVADVRAHAAGVLQEDDMTMVVVRVRKEARS